MSPSGSRRAELLAAVTDHVLSAGLVDLTLRPVAAAIGTSDRMLLYYFGSREDLIAAVLDEIGDRSIAAIDALPGAPTVRSGVNRLWAAYQSEQLTSCLHIYLQAVATGLLGQEPYLSQVRASNQRWAEALQRYFLRCGAPPRRVRRITVLVDSALYGFHLDLLTDHPSELERAVDDLVRAADELGR